MHGRRGRGDMRTVPAELFTRLRCAAAHCAATYHRVGLPLVRGTRALYKRTARTRRVAVARKRSGSRGVVGTSYECVFNTSTARVHRLARPSSSTTTASSCCLLRPNRVFFFFFLSFWGFSSSLSTNTRNVELGVLDVVFKSSPPSHAIATAFMYARTRTFGPSPQASMGMSSQPSLNRPRGMFAHTKVGTHGFCECLFDFEKSNDFYRDEKTITPEHSA